MSVYLKAPKSPSQPFYVAQGGNTLVEILALLLGLIIGYWLGKGRGAGEKPYEFRVQTSRRPPSRDMLTLDAIYIWQLKCQNRRASREHLMRGGEMTAYRWNRASNLITYLKLKPSLMSYQEGVRLIEQEVEVRRGLGAVSSTYVAPW